MKTEAKQTTKEDRDSQLLLLMADLKAQRKKKAKRNFTVTVKIPKGTEEDDTFKGTAGIARLHGSAR
jgi:hypothetical protein